MIPAIMASGPNFHSPFFLLFPRPRLFAVLCREKPASRLSFPNLRTLELIALPDERLLDIIRHQWRGEVNPDRLQFSPSAVPALRTLRLEQETLSSFGYFATLPITELIVDELWSMDVRVLCSVLDKAPQGFPLVQRIILFAYSKEGLRPSDVQALSAICDEREIALHIQETNPSATGAPLSEIGTNVSPRSS